MTSSLDWYQNLQKKLYVAPANPAARALAQEINSNNTDVAGYVDNFKQANDVIGPGLFSKQDALVVIAHGTFQREVARALVKARVKPSRIFLAQRNPGSAPIQYKSTVTEVVSKHVLSFYTKFLSALLKMGRALVPARYQQKVIYYSENFIDTNLLLTYRYHCQVSRRQPVMIASHIQASLARYSQNAGWLTTQRSRLWALLRAGTLVVDHEYTSPYFQLIRHHLPVVQLWHGLPYKALSGNMHYPGINDYCFISSSPWFNRHVFRSIFRAQHYEALGYARNDVFFQSATQRDWCNSESLETMREIVQSTGELIIYAPTYRDNGDNDYSLDFEAIQTWSSLNNVSLILKFHPFISRLFSQALGMEESATIAALPDYPNIYLYPSGSNVYPWLAEAKALITDYSSIAFDFMLTERPIVYYQYDEASYIRQRGAALVEKHNFVLANHVTQPQRLIEALEQALATEAKKAFALKSNALLDKFGVPRKLSAPQLVKYIQSVADKKERLH